MQREITPWQAFAAPCKIVVKSEPTEWRFGLSEKEETATPDLEAAGDRGRKREAEAEAGAEAEKKVRWVENCAHRHGAAASPGAQRVDSGSWQFEFFERPAARSIRRAICAAQRAEEEP